MTYGRSGLKLSKVNLLSRSDQCSSRDQRSSDDEGVQTRTGIRARCGFVCPSLSWNWSCEVNGMAFASFALE